jgi:all-trans-retinol 13,14-reductase
MDEAAPAAKYWSKKSPDTKWDAIVIGSGMGGMTTAALLARFGRKVLVIEQHYVPGGFTHMFNRPGYTWDVGVHAVGEVTARSLTGRILADLTDGRLEWAPLGPVYDQFHLPGGFHIDFPDNPRQFRENLVAAFPEEAAGIDAYLAKVKEVAAGMRGYYLARTMPERLSWLGDRVLARKSQEAFEQRTRDVIAGFTKNEKLRTVLVAQWGYYGSPPSRSSFAIQALVAKHFMHGGYYPVGGAKQIAHELLRTVASAGGWTRIATSVEQILLENGKAVGVRLTSGEEIRAAKVISAAGVASTLRRLLPESMKATPWARDIEQLEPAPAHVCLYLGFKGDIRKAGASAANQWFCNTWDAEQEAWDISQPDALPKAPVLYCSFPSLKDPTHDPGPKEHHTGEVVTFVPWKAFESWQGTRWKRRGPEYDALKAMLQESLLEQFLSWMPQLRPMVDRVELSTPLSTDNFARPMHGSIYGIEPTPERFRNPWLRPRSPIPGLFFSGSEVATVGVIGAMMGGVLAATAAEPVKAIRYLRKMG